MAKGFAVDWLRVVVAGSAALLGVLALATPAIATHDSVTSPSGCISWAQGRSGNWTSPSNCYVGRSSSGYDYHSNYTSGVQYILLGEGYSPGTNDGVFGTNTYNATVSYQNARGLPASGSVSATTWAAMRSELFFVRSDSSFHYYKTGSLLNEVFARRTDGTHQWWVDPVQCGYQHFDFLGVC